MAIKSLLYDLARCVLPYVEDRQQEASHVSVQRVARYARCLPPCFDDNHNITQQFAKKVSVPALGAISTGMVAPVASSPRASLSPMHPNSGLSAKHAHKVRSYPDSARLALLLQLRVADLLDTVASIRTG